MDILKRSSLLAVLFLSAACHDGDPVALPDPDAPPALARLACTVTMESGAMECATPEPGVGGAQGLIIGGQGTNVFLEATNHSYDAGIDRFAIDVTVRNLIPQPLGTTDGTTVHANAVRIFFETEPVASDGSGLPVSVFNHDGTDFFTAAAQKYFKYDQIVKTDSTSAAVNWQFTVADGVASFSFSVYVAAEVQYPDGWVDVTPAVDTMPAGDTQGLTAVVRDALGNVLAGEVVAWGTSDGGIATVDGSGLVTGVAPGTATITATNGPRSGTASIAVCPDLALGEVYVADMPAGSSLCLAGGAEYTIVPVNTSAAGSVSLGVTGNGIVAATEPPAPALLPASVRLTVAPGPRRDHAFESLLRRRERRELAGRRPDAPRGRTAPRLAITPGVPAAGALMDLNVETDNACSTSDIRTGRVVAVGTHVIVMEDTMNPSGGLSAGDYAAIADSFDTFIHPVATGAFGTPSDLDGNGRVIAFYTRAVNELTPPGSPSYIGGFVFARDLYPTASCSTSNVGEMFYMLAADPSGAVNGNARSAAFVNQVTLGTLAHEFQHLINASRRMHVNTPWNGLFEETWMDEGLAHVTEELVFYDRSGLAPRGNLDVLDLIDPGVQAAFFRYAEPNYGRLRQWLLAPHTSGAFQDDDDLATRGAIWAFLRYAADRQGGAESTFWNGLVNTGNVGLENLEAELGTDPLPWFRDFAAATYADDVGGSPPAQFTQPSWNFRDIYAALDYEPGPACSCNYPLEPVDPASGVEEAFTLSDGGAAAYLRMGVSGGTFAGVSVLSGGVAPPATVRLAVVRRK